MKVLVVDDEPLARARLIALLHTVDGIEVVGEADNGRSAIERAQAAAPDLVLLDIRMPVMDGLEAARHLSGLARPPAVVFTTAFDEHALEAFEASAVDYLLKPVRESRLREAIGRAARLQPGPVPAAALGDSQRTCISARVRGGLRLIPIEEVRCFRAEQKYVNVHHGDGETLIEDSLKQLEAEFGDRFVRIHRNALVAEAHVLALERTGDGRYRVRLDGCAEGQEVSRRHLGEVRRRLRELAGR